MKFIPMELTKSISKRNIVTRLQEIVDSCNLLLNKSGQFEMDHNCPYLDETYYRMIKLEGRLHLVDDLVDGRVFLSSIKKNINDLKESTLQLKKDTADLKEELKVINSEKV